VQNPVWGEIQGRSGRMSGRQAAKLAGMGRSRGKEGKMIEFVELEWRGNECRLFWLLKSL
jgi:hypothetical protein